MKGEAMIAEMRRLVLGEKWLIGTVARRFGVHHSVVRRAVCGQAAACEHAAPKSVIEPFKPYIVERLEKYPELTATRLLQELRERGYTYGIAVLRRFVAQVRGPRPRKVYLRIEVEPGDQAQVDWGSFGHLRVGSTQRPLSVFVMVLSWSRALFLDFSLDPRMETFQAMHRRAFEFFGGVPRRILYDNLKSVVLHHVGATVQFNPTFLGFAGHYLFEPTAAPVRYPEAKGRAEAIIKYIRHAFFYGRTFSSLGLLRGQAATWRDEVANARIHATTRERPQDRLLIERKRLRPLPEHPADTALRIPAIVSKEARVRLDSNTYSVPPSLVGKNVLVRADDSTLRVVDDGVVVAEHVRSWDRRRAIEDSRAYRHVARATSRCTRPQTPCPHRRAERRVPDLLARDRAAPHQPRKRGAQTRSVDCRLRRNRCRCRHCPGARSPHIRRQPRPRLRRSAAVRARPRRATRARHHRKQERRRHHRRAPQLGDLRCPFPKRQRLRNLPTRKALAHQNRLCRGRRSSRYRRHQRAPRRLSRGSGSIHRRALNRR
ncbi:MAG: IS21 family transposase [Deltaproteobacteria bacterium]|nr:IS21 family transposase [Deltaproteobacteria bacterium]